MAVDTSAGFKFEYRYYGGRDVTIEKRYFKDDETLTKGDVLNLESGEVDLGATDDSAFFGVARETKVGVDSTTLIECYSDADAVYSVYDPNARVKGQNLDIAGATGAMTVASSVNADLIVVGGEDADQRTLVMFTPAETWIG